MSLRRIGAAYATSLLSVGSALLTNLWLLRVVAANVEKASFGVYCLVQTTLMFAGVVQLGLDVSAARRIAECLGHGDRDGATRAYRQLVRFNRYAAAAILAIAGVSAVGFSAWSDWPPEQSRLAAGLFAIAGVGLSLNTIARSPAAALIGTERMHVVNLVGVVRSVATTGFAYGLLKAGAGISAMATAEIVSQAGAWAVLAAFRIRFCDWTLDSPSDPNRGFRALLRYAAMATVGGLAWSIESGIDVFLIEAIPGGGGLGMVAVFTMWWRFPQLAFTLCTNLSWSAFPSFAAVRSDPALARSLFAKVAVPLVGIASLALFGLGVWLPPFVRVWLGSGYEVPDGRRLAILMALLVTLRSFGNLFGMFWLSSGRAGLTTTLSLAQVVAKIGLALWLIRVDGLCGLLTASCIAILIQIAGVGWFLGKDGFLNLCICIQAFAIATGLIVAAWFVGPVVADYGVWNVALGIAGTVVVVGSVLAAWCRNVLHRLKTSSPDPIPPG